MLLNIGADRGAYLHVRTHTPLKVTFERIKYGKADKISEKKILVQFSQLLQR